MEIYYFGTNGEKIGPITKEGLINLAEAGVISEETRFEVGGKKYKGKQIKNLQPIFERLKAAVPPPAFPEPETPPDSPTIIAPPAPATGELPPTVGGGFEEFSDGDVYGTASDLSGPSEAAKLSYLHRETRTQEDPFETEPFDSSKAQTARTFFSRFKRKPKESKKTKGSQKQEKTPAPTSDIVFEKFWTCYKICTVFLHVAFIIAIVICLTGLLKGAKWKHVGKKGYKSLTTTLNPLIQTYSYKEFGEEVDKLLDVHPFESIRKDIDKWFRQDSFKERTDKMFIQGNEEKIETFEKMVSYLKKATEVTYEDEIEKVETSVAEQRANVSVLREKLEDLKKQRRELDNKNKEEEENEENDKPVDYSRPKSTTTYRDYLTDNHIDREKEEKERLDAEIKALEEKLQREEDTLRKMEEQLRNLESASSLGDKGKVIDEVDPLKGRTRYTQPADIVTPKDVDELIEYVHNYMSLRSELFEDIYENGSAIFKASKTSLLTYLSGYLAILLLCYFIAARVRAAEEIQKTRFLLEENFKKSTTPEQQAE